MRASWEPRSLPGGWWREGNRHQRLLLYWSRPCHPERSRGTCFCVSASLQLGERVGEHPVILSAAKNLLSLCTASCSAIPDASLRSFLPSLSMTGSRRGVPTIVAYSTKPTSRSLGFARDDKGAAEHKRSWPLFSTSPQHPSDILNIPTDLLHQRGQRFELQLIPKPLHKREVDCLTVEVAGEVE
jgi:hypothetical protein